VEYLCNVTPAILHGTVSAGSQNLTGSRRRWRGAVSSPRAGPGGSPAQGSRQKSMLSLKVVVVIGAVYAPAKTIRNKKAGSGRKQMAPLLIREAPPEEVLLRVQGLGFRV